MESSLPRAAFIGDAGRINAVYAQGRRAQVEQFTDCAPGVFTAADLGVLRETEVLFSTWGIPKLTEEHIDGLPSLRAVFYAAGSVQGFARPLLNRDITVVSAWAANAVPVAEWTLAQILLANKGYFRNQRDFVATRKNGPFRGRGNFGATVSLLGAGQIGRLVIKLLQPFDLEILVFDPLLPADVAASLGIEKVELDEAFARGAVVSNHLANLPATVGLLTGAHFAAMPRDATFINTGRGAAVRQTEMIEVLRTRPDLSALLDVTQPDPTPPDPTPPDSPLWELPNVYFTTHIAGSIGDEVMRMADYAIEEFVRWQRREPLRYAVSLEMLERMA